VVGGVELVALAPPCPSVSPGAGNKPKQAIKPRKRAKKIEERYVGQAGRLERDMDTPAIGRHDDGNGSAVSTIEPAHRASGQVDLRVNPAAFRQSSIDR
jgi:hypothetical protein